MKISKLKFLMRPMAVLVIMFLGVLTPKLSSADCILGGDGTKQCLKAFYLTPEGEIGQTLVCDIPVGTESGDPCVGDDN